MSVAIGRLGFVLVSIPPILFSEPPSAPASPPPRCRGTTMRTAANVHFDEPLRDKLDALAARVGSDRTELMRLAAQRVLEDPE